MDDRFEPTGPSVYEYLTQETSLGTWRRHVYSGGSVYSEFRSHAEILGFPVIHRTSGICPETGRRTTARGFIAIGRRAVGFLAIGQLALGVVSIGQACIGALALGQASLGYISVGQLAMSYRLGIGQMAVGQTAIGQIALGDMVLAQAGFGGSVWSAEREDPEAVSYFKSIPKTIEGLLGS